MSLSCQHAGQPTYVMSAGDKILESQPLSEQYHQVLSVYTKHLADFVIPSSRIKLMETLGQGKARSQQILS